MKVQRRKSRLGQKKKRLREARWLNKIYGSEDLG